MTSIDYIGGISRDTNVLGDNVYASMPGRGQGCGTIWYPSVKQARKVIDGLGLIPDGRNSGLCERCSCHYSFSTPEWSKYPEFACREWKKEVARGSVKHIERLEK